MDLSRFLTVLSAGGVVACATETQIGLLADALRPDAVARVQALKGRPEGAPIAVLLPDARSLPAVARPLSPAAAALAARHWPGPLTLVVVARPGLPAPLVLDGRVGVRVPGPSPALELARAFGGPLTATSANRTGEPAALTPEDVERAFEGRGVAVVPAPAPGGPPSTVLDVTVDPPRVVRAGAVAIDG